MNDWKAIKLENFATLKYGKLPSKDISSGKYPIWSGYKYVGTTNIFNCPKGTPIVVARGVGGTGDVKIAKDDCFLTNLSISVSLNDKICNPHFFTYYFAKDNLRYLDSGSAQSQITIESLKNVVLKLPPLSEQKKIAAILSALDEKIETNRKINERLEELAQAIFKSWFIDFEPFGGQMPEDWGEGTLNEMVESIISGDWGKEEEIGSYIKKVLCIRGADLNNIKVGESGNAPTRYIIQKNYNQKALENHDIIVEISGGSPTQSTGRIAMISSILLSENNHSIVCTNFCKALKIKKVYNHYFNYLWNWLYDNKIMFIYENGSNGLKNLNLTNLLEREKCNIPSERTALEFNNVIEPIFSKIQRLGVESARLAEIRDSLLPKLMSGELIPE